MNYGFENAPQHTAQPVYINKQVLFARLHTHSLLQHCKQIFLSFTPGAGLWYTCRCCDNKHEASHIFETDLMIDRWSAASPSNKNVKLVEVVTSLQLKIMH